MNQEHEHVFEADGGPCTICGKNWGQIKTEQEKSADRKETDATDNEQTQ